MAPPRSAPRGSGGVGYGVGGVGTDDGDPFANAPLGDQAVRHVPVGGREGGGDLGGSAPEQQDGSVNRLGQRPAEDELAPLDRPPGQREMGRT